MKIYKISKKYLLNNPKRFFIYALLCILTSIISVIMPYITGGFIDNLISLKKTYFIYQFCILIFSITLCKLVIGYYLTVSFSKMQVTMGYNFNMDVLKHLQNCPIQYLINEDLVYLNNKINNDCNAIIIYCLNTMQEILISVITFIIPIYVLLKLNIYLTIICILFLLLYIVVYLFLRNKIYLISFKALESLNLYFSKLQEQLDLAVFSKIFGVINILNERVSNSYKKMEKSAIQNQKMNYIFSGFDNIISMLSTIAIYLYGGISIINGTFTIGQFTIFISYFSLLLSSVTYFFQFGKNYQNILVSYDRIVNILKITLEKKGSIKPTIITQISINNLSFSFKKKTLYNNLTQDLSVSHIYALTGDNGVGKTTLINILLGIYQSKDEIIKYNNIDLNKIDTEYLRKYKVGYIDQNPIFFNDTLIYNIFLKNDISDTEIEELKQWLMYFDIEYLKKYIDNTFEYHTLSGGERQKLALIRVIMKKTADILILDEPSSALDNFSKIKLINLLKNLKTNKLIIVISHDNEFKKICDIIIDL